MEPKALLLSGCLVGVLLLGVVVRAQDNAPFNVNQINEDVQNTIKNVDVNSTLEKAEDVFWKKCQTVAKDRAQEVFNKSKDARSVLETCFKSKVNMTELQAEMAEARPQGSLDEVFKKYCDRKGDLQKCMLDYTATLEPCLTELERKNLKVVHNITEQLSSFICYKDGDRIALFIAEKGPECLTEKTDKIQECVQNYTNVKNLNNLNSININSSNFNVDDLTQFSLDFDDDACMRMDNLKECVVTQLMGCSEPTPSNIADALFKFVRKATPCVNMAAPASKQTGANPSSAEWRASVAATTLLSALAAVALF